MIQSHYIPLESPYRIIYAGGALGLQIGTLLVVHDLGPSPRGGNRMPSVSQFKTASYPVVTYVNKTLNNLPLINDVNQSGLFSEGVVWENVRQDQVATVCLEGQELEWDDYMDILGPDLFSIHSPEELNEKTQKAFRMFEVFYNLGGKIKQPKSCTDTFDHTIKKKCQYYEVTLKYSTVETAEGSLRCFRSDFRSNPFFLAITEDVSQAYAMLERQRQFYQNMLRRIVDDAYHTITAKIEFKPPKDSSNKKMSDLMEMIQKGNY